MSATPNCTNKTCNAPATVLAAGPHGAVPYCDKHAKQYAGIMRVVGAPVRLLPIVDEVEL